MAYRGNMQECDIERLKVVFEQLLDATTDIGVERIVAYTSKDGYGADITIDSDNSFHIVVRDDGDVENRRYVRKWKTDAAR